MRRPLDRFRSIKLKLGIVIVAAVVVTLLVNEIGIAMNIKPFTRGATSVAIGLVTPRWGLLLVDLGTQDP